MPVSGRPTNAALLKITQGSSGPKRNPFQNVRKGTGAGDGEPVTGLLRVRFAQVPTRAATAAASNIERITTATDQFRRACRARRGVVKFSSGCGFGNAGRG